MRNMCPNSGALTSAERRNLLNSLHSTRLPIGDHTVRYYQKLAFGKGILPAI
jgi:hypothetical protein